MRGPHDFGIDDAERAALRRLFDEDYYLSNNPDVRVAGLDAFEHFLTYGWRERRSPGPDFDVGFYLETYPDVAGADINPLIHFERYGRDEGRLTRPVMPEKLRTALSEYFDEAFYLTTNPDVRASGMDALLHFHLHGWREGRDPHPEFNVKYYLSDSPDVAEARINPLFHYVYWGRSEGRRAAPLRFLGHSGPQHLEDNARAELAKHFDERYYLVMNPDVRQSGIDPLRHFHEWGWREGRNPNPSFDVHHYLRSNPDVANSGMNPLLHYSYAGQTEGRSARRPLDAARRQLEAALPAHKRAADWAAANDRSPSLSVAELEHNLGTVTQSRQIIVAISHDDYASSVGGIQNLIADELHAFRSLGRDYIHVSPSAPRLALAKPDDPAAFRFSLRLNGGKIGVVTAGTLAMWLSGAREIGATVDFTIHHLMGHAPEALLILLHAAECIKPIVWIHDFFTICPSYALMRNDVTFCGGPPQDSSACLVCCYGEERPDHVRRINAFLDSLHATLVTPSESARDWWRRTTGAMRQDVQVAPLARLVLVEREHSSEPFGSREQIRVAHLGGRAFHKGWFTFEELANRLRDDPRYVFFQLGHEGGPPMPGNVTQVPVFVTPSDRDAMIAAVAEQRIDVVVNWALWPETFNFTTYETLAAGAYVVARRAAGNVWPAVRDNAPEQGHAVDDEAALIELFEGKGLEEALASARPRRGALFLGKGSAAIL